MNISRQSGMTVLELMIAGVLGVILVYFIISLMMSSARTSHLSEGVSQAQENSRIVMEWLNDLLPMAGYNSNYLSQESSGFSPVMPVCTTTVTPPSDGANCSFDTNSNANGGDRLAIRRKTGGESAAARDLQTCGGEDLPLSITEIREDVVDVYWVELNTDDIGHKYQLSCVTYNKDGIRQGNARSVAHGIESMQFLAGVGTGDGKVERFVTPSKVTDWNKVVAVRIALLAREFGDHSLNPETRTYGLLNSDPITFEDGTARIVQNLTIWFPNTKILAPKSTI